jgi:hypothetical protein
MAPAGVSAGDEPADDAGEVSSLSAAFSRGTIRGLVRYSGQYRDSNLHVIQDGQPHPDEPTDKKQEYSAVGGDFGYETAPWFSTSVGATVYAAFPLGDNPSDRMGLGGLNEDNGRQEAYLVLGEAYFKVQTGEHRVVVGRHEMPNYRFVSLSDVRFSPVTHEGITYENRSLPGFQFNAAYITGQKERNAFDFEGMARAAGIQTGCGAVDAYGNCLESGSRKLIRGSFNPSDFDGSGAYAGAGKDLSMAAVTYAGAGLNLEGWEYYTEDLLNTIYLYGQYAFKPMADDLTLSLAGQYVNQQDVGDHIAGTVDTWFYGIKAQAAYAGITTFVSYNEVAYNEDSYDGGTLFVRWGTPQMFNSFQVQDSELAGTKSIGVGLQYDFGAKGIIPGVLMRVRYADYDLPDSLDQIDARQDRSETTLDIRYSFTRDTGFGLFSHIDGLSIFFRLAYNDYKTDYDFAAYKALHGYEFNSVTDNFLDYRLYLDYRF